MAWLQLEHFLERIVGFVRLVALFIENAQIVPNFTQIRLEC